MDVEMKVNHLPAYTWNKLKLNEALVKLDVNRNVEFSLLSSNVPEGITYTENASQETINNFFDGVGISNAREKYVAGKFPIYAGGEFATGMGAEMDEFVSDHCEGTDVYRVEAGVKAKKPVCLHFTAKKSEEINCCPEEDGVKTCTLNYINQCLREVSGTRQLVNAKKISDNTYSQLIYAGKDSESTFILDYASDDDEGLLSVSTKVYLEEGAKVHLIKAQLLGKNMICLDDNGVILSEASKFDFIQMELGSKKTYTGLYANEEGMNSEITSECGYLLKDEQKLDLNYAAVQRGKKTRSSMLFKGIVSDRAEKTFRGTIDFRCGSSGSVGDEQEDVLLLGENIVNKTIPLILCEEEDVDGRHGATIGRLPEDMLFYMKSRGIPEKSAERLVIRARLNDINRKIPDNELNAYISKYIEESFE